MRYWLFKSEPGTWSWDDQVARGDAGEEWDGVRNYAARNNMCAMARGDLGFFYHSVGEKAVVGIVEVIAEAHPDSKAGDARWACVDIRAVEPLPRPVTLADIRARPELAGMELVRNSRLSVSPVREGEWRLVREMGGLERPPS